jgi:hypothetical protein
MTQRERAILNPELAWQKQHSTRRIFTGIWDLNLMKKVVKCYTWSTALYDVEN